MIKIEGFTQEQRIIADIVWQFQTFDEITHFVSSLDEEQARNAYVVVEMILATTLDDVKETDRAVAALKQFMLKSNND